MMYFVEENPIINVVFFGEYARKLINSPILFTGFFLRSPRNKHKNSIGGISSVLFNVRKKQVNKIGLLSSFLAYSVFTKKYIIN